MNDNTFRNIIQKNKTCYFISPHFDDAALSAGSLITYLHQYIPIVVINVFTQADSPPYTLSAKMFLKQCGFQDGKELYTLRTLEDSSALQSITHKTINLHFTDALWRKKMKIGTFSQNFTALFPEIIHLYPTYTFHIIGGIVHREDLSLLTILKDSLKRLIPEGVVFCPLGIGNHVDHILVKWACEDLFDDLIYWADYPYTNRNGTPLPTNIQQTITFSVNQSLKRDLLKKYHTQYHALFKDTEPILKSEKYFTRYFV